jgi:hypothetical protein
MACVESGAVRYVTRKDNVFALEVPVDAAVNAADVQEFKRQKTEGGAGAGKVRRCSLTVSQPVLKPPMVSAISA